MNWAYDQAAGGILNKAVLVTLANHANSEGRCWPGLDRLTHRTEASRRAVIKSLGELERRGLISIKRRGGDGSGRKSNLYELAMGQGARDAQSGKVHDVHKAGQGARDAQRGNVHQVHQLSALDGRQCAPGAPEQKEEQSKNSHSLSTPAGRFEDFWSVYPRKVKKKEARHIWTQKKLDARADELIDDVRTRCKRDRQWCAGFIPHPTSYLRGERWEDAIEPPRPEAGNGLGLPRRDEDLAAWAVTNGFRGPRPGESFDAYRHALQGEHRKTAHQEASHGRC